VFAVPEVLLLGAVSGGWSRTHQTADRVGRFFRLPTLGLRGCRLLSGRCPGGADTDAGQAAAVELVVAAQGVYMGATVYLVQARW